MVNTVIEAVGVVLVLAALITLAVVAGTWHWQAGAAVAAVESAAVGAVLILLATARERAAKVRQ